MAVNETIVTGRYFRRCTDAANKVWQRISFWHKASDCEFDDNKNAQTKVGAIKGITTSTSVTETGYAADMTTVKNLQTQIDELNSNLGGAGCGIFYMTNGKTFTSNSATLTLQSDKYSYDKNYYTFSENTVIINKSGNYVVCGGTSTGYANIALSVNERIKIGKGAPGQTSDTFIRNFNTIVSLSKGDVCKVITTGTAWNGRATGFSSKSYFSIAYIPD